MGVTFVDRSVCQTQLATLITAKLVGTGKPVQKVYDYQVDDFGNESPVVIVTSPGSNRRNPLKSARSASLVFLDVHVFVVYADKDASWTPAQSEAALNQIEAGIAAVIADNNETGAWMKIDFNGQSEINPIPLGGVEYRYEVIPLVCEVRA